jgi:DNA repair protein RadC
MSNCFNLDLFRRTYQGPTIRVRLVVTEEAASYLPTIQFTSSAEVATYFCSLEEEPREVLIAVHLDNKHHALSIEEVSRGTLTGSLFDSKAILQGAILANAAALILVHNHPSGDPKPSPRIKKLRAASKNAVRCSPSGCSIMSYWAPTGIIVFRIGGSCEGLFLIQGVLLETSCSSFSNP